MNIREIIMHVVKSHMYAWFTTFLLKAFVRRVKLFFLFFTCPWRIANLAGIPRIFALLLECGNARSRDPFHPSPHDRRPSCRSRRPPLRSSRVRAPQTSTPNPQSLAPARSPSPPFGPPGRRLLRSVDAAVPPDPFRHRSDTFDSFPPPPGPDEPKVSPPLLFPAEEEARAQRTP